MTANQIARNTIQANVAADIRRVSVGSQRISLDVALANWEYFWQQGRYTEARSWWSVAHSIITEGK